MNGDMKLFKNFQYTLTLEPIEYNIFKGKMAVNNETHENLTLWINSGPE